MILKSNGKKKLFFVRNSKIHGRGVFASRRIRKGQRIMEYVGERITPEEEERRYGDGNGNGNGKYHHTFLFEVNEKVTIDANRKGNSSRYVNHSCEPNCESIDEDGRIFVEAIKNIQPGVELTYDYQYPTDGESLEEAKKAYPCRCGRTKCRRTIVDIN